MPRYVYGTARAELFTDADVLDEDIGDRVFWTRVNVGEAWPGVPTPLTWTWAGPGIDAIVCRAWTALGAYSAKEKVPRRERVDERFAAISQGRVLLNLDLMRSVGDRMPFNSGDKIETALFGAGRPSTPSRSVPARYPFVAFMGPRAIVRARRSLLETLPVTRRFWSDAVSALMDVPRDASIHNERARTLLRESADRFVDVGEHQAVSSVAGQGAYDALDALCRRFGLPDATGVLATDPDLAPELETVNDLWRHSRGELDLAGFLARHGYHAPVQAELAAHSWRMDPRPVRALATTYTARAEHEDPMSGQRARLAERSALENELLGRAPRALAPVVRAALYTARRTVPLREVSRMQFLQLYDVARAAAVVLAEDMVAREALDRVDDAFYLTLPELLSGQAPPDGLIGARRRRRAFYQRHEVPLIFRGTPVLTEITLDAGKDEFRGLGGSPGVVEGLARVITDPHDSDELADGEILVCETTNPTWASFFLVAGGVVVDIGAPLSHAAILSREMGIPCVMDTKDARHCIRTGDRIRVDGSTGLVQVLERAAEATVA
jgi:pyruvate,water dikinase